MIPGIIKVEVSVALTKTLIIPDRSQKPNLIIVLLYIVLKKICIIAKKRIIAAITVYFQTLKNVQLSDKQIFTVFIKQSSAEKLNAFLTKVSLKKTVDEQTDECLASLKREAILTSLSMNLTLLLEIMHCAHNLQIIN